MPHEVVEEQAFGIELLPDGIEPVPVGAVQLLEVERRIEGLSPMGPGTELGSPEALQLFEVVGALDVVGGYRLDVGSEQVAVGPCHVDIAGSPKGVSRHE